MAGLWAAFPDLTFEIASQSKDASSVHWIMHVTNHGSMNGLPPTGRAAEDWGRSRHGVKAMEGFCDGSLAKAGYTSVWTLHPNNGFMLCCDACGTMTRNAEDGQACRCGAVLPDHPSYW